MPTTVSAPRIAIPRAVQHPFHAVRHYAIPATTVFYYSISNKTGTVIFKVRLLRARGRRLRWRHVVNSAPHVGQLLTHSLEMAGHRYNVATLRPIDPMADALVPDLYEPVLLLFAVGAFRLRGFERMEVDGGHVGVVQEWHCEQP